MTSEYAPVASARAGTYKGVMGLAYSRLRKHYDNELQLMNVTW